MDGTNRISDQAARAVIRDLDGKQHELRALWADRPTVLVFLRHFG